MKKHLYLQLISANLLGIIFSGCNNIGSNSNSQPLSTNQQESSTNSLAEAQLQMLANPLQQNPINIANNQYTKTVKKVAAIINGAIITSYSAMELELKGLTTMGPNDFATLYLKVVSARNKGLSFDQLYMETANKFNIPYNSRAANLLYELIFLYNTTLNSDDRDSNKQLIKLAQGRSAVCDKITVFAYTLFKQEKQFKAVTMLPAALGDDHVFLLLKFPDLPDIYVFDAWLPFIEPQINGKIDTSKIFFGTLEDFLVFLPTKLPGIQNLDQNFAQFVELSQTRIANSDYHSEIWGKIGLDINDPQALKMIADALKSSVTK